MHNGRKNGNGKRRAARKTHLYHMVWWYTKGRYQSFIRNIDIYSLIKGLSFILRTNKQAGKFFSCEQRGFGLQSGLRTNKQNNSSPARSKENLEPTSRIILLLPGAKKIPIFGCHCSLIHRVYITLFYSKCWQIPPITAFFIRDRGGLIPRISSRNIGLGYVDGMHGMAWYGCIR